MKIRLTLHPDKTRLIEFGRFAAENYRKRGQGHPETFDYGARGGRRAPSRAAS